MAGYRKLGGTSDQRKALIRSQVVTLLYHGHIRAAGTRMKETREVAEGLTVMAVKEKDNFETIKVTAKVARKDKDDKRIKEVVNDKEATIYDEVEKEIKKDLPLRSHARGQMLRVPYGVTEVLAAAARKKKNARSIDLVAKILDDATPKYIDRNGGCTRIVKIGQRKGGGAAEILIELI